MIKRFVDKQGNRSNNGYLVAKYNGKKQHPSKKENTWSCKNLSGMKMARPR